MSFNLKTYRDKLLFIPLGGANEIGVNVNLYHFHGKFIMVDCGSGFADESLPGVDMIVPNLKFIEKHKDNLLGLILTHAHEDHLGAVQYLWNSLQCPIYATNFTKNFLKKKVSEYLFAKDMNINEIKSGDKFVLGPFLIEMIPLTHSSPEMHALMIRTSMGNILHTGDWKFDPDPVVGKLSDFSRLKKCGDEGILALICDSTNVFNPGVSGSESDVRKSLIKIINSCPQMVVVTTFASNLARLDSLIFAGQQLGRKIVLAGKSLHRMVVAAQESGYLKDIVSLIDARYIKNYKREKLLIIATGCQGETMAATAKIANKTHPSIELIPKDTVIFSSKIIPGNDKKIFKLFNTLVRMGVEVITERDHFVHVSGHPAIEELKKMYALIRPEICIPVHGEPVHIHEHVKLAKNSGIKKTIEVENGSVVLIDKKSPQIIGVIENGYLAVDGEYLIPDFSPIFKIRRILRDSGIVIASLTVNRKGELLTKPLIVTPGVLDPNDDKVFLNFITQEVIETLNKQWQQSTGRLLANEIEKYTKLVIRKLLKYEIKKSPMVIVNVTEINQLT